VSRLSKEYDPIGGGLSPTSISRYESSESLPGLKEFRLLAETLGVPIGWLLYGSLEREKRPEFSGEERSLMHALRTLIASQKDDAFFGNPPEYNWISEQARMEKIQRARKPTTK
jgi:transcriptional regulator with XRE-family HTH domain